MNVLFLTLAPFDSISERGVHTDLLRAFRDRGHNVHVACPVERRDAGSTRVVQQDQVQVLRVRTGNVTQTNPIEKGLSTMLLDKQFRAAIDSFWGGVNFDLVLYSTPPVTFDGVVEHMKRSGARLTYLLLKDIFPQNAVDLGLMRRGSPVWRYFRYREQRLYAVSDRIGCMSPANCAYLIERNPGLESCHIEVCPNSIEPRPLEKVRSSRRTARQQLNVSDDAVVFLYGGNFGKPQGVGFIVECMRRVRDLTDVVFFFVGSGTEYGRLERYVRDECPQNVRLHTSLSRDQYDVLLSAADVGLVFLDKRFTIPNFPSRLTGYMEAALPVIAATDRSSDLGDTLSSSNSGLWVPSDDADAFRAAVEVLRTNPQMRSEMGEAGRRHLDAHYTVEAAYRTIMKHFD